MNVQKSLVTALFAFCAAALPAVAFAQQTDATNAPSYSKPATPSNADTIHGRVVSFDGGLSLQVRDDRGFIDNIQLRQGTIINPNGLKLAAGMTVTVSGVNRGSALVADQIDTPYQTYGDVVDPYGPYAYPFYGYGYGYGYGPRVSIGIGFGGGFYGHGRFR